MGFHGDRRFIAKDVCQRKKGEVLRQICVSFAPLFQLLLPAHQPTMEMDGEVLQGPVAVRGLAGALTSFQAV